MGYDPELYHLLHRGNPGDVSWYVDHCAGAETVLELGCGDGRVIEELCAAGHRCVGVDLDPAMLDRAKARLPNLPVEWLQGDMERIELGRRFDRVLIPFNSLYCLMSEEAQQRALARAADHLAPGGRLIFDLYAADPLPDPTVLNVPRHAVAQIERGAQHIEVFESSIEDPEAQTIMASYHYVIYDDDGEPPTRASWTIPQRYLFADQLLAMLARIGLVVEAMYGDFDGNPFSEESPHMVMVVSRGDRP